MELIPIGGFSRITRLSVKALRLYDGMGILPPARVDDDTGYRYYAWQQVNRATLIRLLRAADVPLDEIRELLADPTAESASAKLAAHRERLERHAEEVRAALSLLQTIIEQEEGLMPYTVEVKEVPDQPVLRVRKRATLATIGDAVGAAFGELMGYMGGQGIPCIAPPLCVYPDQIDETTEGEIWICMPAPAGSPGAGSVEAYTVPAGTVACTMHRGPFDGIGAAYAAVYGWVQENGREPAGPMRETYLTDPDTVPPEEWLTEVQWPIL